GNGQTHHGRTECRPCTEITRDHRRLRGLRVSPAQNSSAKPSVFPKTGCIELLDVDRSLHVAELTHVEVMIARSRPAQEWVRCSLHYLLPRHHAAAMVPKNA